MPISDKDIKLLWGRAGGRCSRPGCRMDLTNDVEQGDPYLIGEMAHVIASSPKGPRGQQAGGEDTYSNLILLCPTDHRTVDKAPAGVFPAEMLHGWKRDHEEQIRLIGSTERFKTNDDLTRTVRGLLAENHEIWETFGPKSKTAQQNPGSNAHRIWEMRRADRIVPNNRRIINIIRANDQLLTTAQLAAFAKFSNHAEAYEENVFDRLDDYPLFPSEFEEAFN